MFQPQGMPPSNGLDEDLLQEPESVSDREEARERGSHRINQGSLEFDRGEGQRYERLQKSKQGRTENQE